MIGELFEHVGARLRLALGQVAGQLDLLRGHPRDVMKCAFERQIDEPGDAVAPLTILGADRELARDQGRHAHRLQRRQQVADPAVRLVDTIDENEVRNALLVEHAERRRGERGPCRIGIDHDDGEVGDRDRPRGIGRKSDRPGRIDDPEAVPEPREMVEVGLGRSAALARFGARIADAGGGAGGAVAPDRIGGEQHRLGQPGLARAGRSDQRDDPSTVGGAPG